MTDITISAGTREYAYTGEDGVFAGTLASHTIEGPFESKQKPGETYSVHEWGFSLDDVEGEGTMVWVTSGLATGPKSKTFAIITALLGGQQPPVGKTLNVEKHLFGRRALLDVRTNDKGYKAVENVTPLPKSMQRGAPAPAGRAPAQDADTDLPF